MRGSTSPIDRVRIGSEIRLLKVVEPPAGVQSAGESLAGPARSAHNPSMIASCFACSAVSQLPNHRVAEALALSESGNLVERRLPMERFSERDPRKPRPGIWVSSQLIQPVRALLADVSSTGLPYLVELAQRDARNVFIPRGRERSRQDWLAHHRGWAWSACARLWSPAPRLTVPTAGGAPSAWPGRESKRDARVLVIFNNPSQARSAFPGRARESPTALHWKIP